MGGSIKIAFRLHDGTVHSDCRWTNAFPDMINSLEMISDDADYLRSYATAPSEYRGDTTVSPYGYGLIVIDAITHKIYSWNAYSTPGMTSPAHIILRNPARNKQRAAIASVLGVDADEDQFSEEFQKWEILYRKGRMTAIDVVENIRIPLPREEGRSLIDEMYQLREDERVDDKNRFYELLIDLSPWKVLEFADNKHGLDYFRSLLKLDGFPLTVNDETAWDEFVRDRFEEEDA